MKELKNTLDELKSLSSDFTIHTPVNDDTINKEISSILKKYDHILKNISSAMFTEFLLYGECDTQKYMKILDNILKSKTKK